VGEIEFNAYKEWYISWGPPGTGIKVKRTHVYVVLKPSNFEAARSSAEFGILRNFALWFWIFTPNYLHIFVKPLDKSWFYEKPRGSATLGLPGCTLDP
jgi:hypothetical protein